MTMATDFAEEAILRYFRVRDGGLHDIDGRILEQAVAELTPPALVIGTAKHTDDTGLDWLQVVVASDHGDATFAVYPWSDDTGAGAALAAAHVRHLVGLFEVLGIPAVRGEVDHA